MGRPLGKKFFGGDYNYRQTGEAVGGEGLASVATGTAGSGYSQGLTATVAAPQIAGGETATISVSVNSATGAITGYTVTNAGSGYTSAPTVTLVPAATVTRAGTGNNGESTITLASTTGIFVGMQVTGSAGLGTGNAANSVLVASVDSSTQITVATAHDGAVSGTLTFTDIGSSGVPGARALTSGAAARRNAIAPQVRITTTNRTSGNDIVKQKGTTRFVCTSQDGTALCKLVAATPSAAGEMAIAATDSLNSTYWVRKITKNKVELVQNADGGSGFDFATGDTAKWTITGSASAPAAGGHPNNSGFGPTVADMGTVVLANA